MTCLRHELRMISLVLRGRVHGPEHSRLLRDIRACRVCGGSDGYAEVHVADEPPARTRRRGDHERTRGAVGVQPLHPGGT